jgi:hypothetical protein
MKRENLLAGALLVVGLLLAGGAVAARYASIFDPAPSDIAHLISRALGDADPPLPHGDSVLSTGGVVLSATSGETAPKAPGLARDLYPGPWASASESMAGTQPSEWARRAATQNPAALRAWLGWAVLSVATTDGDTVRLRMYRLRLQPGCPLVDRVEAALARPTGSWETRIARVDGGCWE